MSFLLRRLSILLLLALTSAAQAPVLDYEATGRQLRQAITTSFGMFATGSNWITRKQVADILDFVWAPINDPTNGLILYYPFAVPEIACFTRAFYMQSMDEMLAAMDNAVPSSEGVRTYYLNSSAIVVEMFVPTGPNGSLQPFRVAVDYADVVYDVSNYFNPQCIPEADYLARVNALADRIDFSFVTHGHPDHISWFLYYAMATRGKPTFVPANIVNLVAMLGAPIFNLVALTTGTYTLNQYFSVHVMEGAQFNFPNNVYFINYNVPVSPGSPNDGVTFCHFGDNDHLPQLESFVAALDASGEIKDHVLTANCSNLTPFILSHLQPAVRYLSPCYEFYHFVGGGWFGLSMPNEGQVQPAIRMPHFWGESSHYPNDF